MELQKLLEKILYKWSDQNVVSVSRAHCLRRFLAKDEGEVTFGWLFTRRFLRLVVGIGTALTTCTFFEYSFLSRCIFNRKGFE